MAKDFTDILTRAAEVQNTTQKVVGFQTDFIECFFLALSGN